VSKVRSHGQDQTEVDSHSFQSGCDPYESCSASTTIRVRELGIK
jgi:hypothetical protein